MPRFVATFFLVFLLSLPALAQSADNSSYDALQYRLGSGDKIKVTVFGEEDLSGEFKIDGSGNMAMPLIGKVAVGGKTLREMETRIRDHLLDGFLVNPQISAEVMNYRPFYILGEVKSPGSYPYVEGMKAINAIILAGGYTYRAKEERLIIIRANDTDRIKRTANPETIILPGDILEVPERFF